MAIELWLKQHTSGERVLAKDLASYFGDQVSRIAEAVADFSSPGPDDVAQLFNESDEHETLLQVVKPHLYQLVGVGAQTEVDRVSKKKSAELWLKKLIIDGQHEFDFATQLPDRIVDAIQVYVTDLTAQDYWQEIQQATAGKIGEVLKQGLEDGLNGSEMAGEIRKAMGGDVAKSRARAIARTETTGAMNSGHLVGMEELSAEGLIAGKTWLAITDQTTRATHAELNDTTVGVKEDFNVGGSMAPYPGHASLPPEERIYCRCTIISEIA